MEIQVVHQVLCLKKKLGTASEMLHFFKKLVDGKSPKKEVCVS
jgi:hypothetical protein